ncbi:MAG TPA: dockerin type I domain-containing protein [Candidatus Saccharimonadia bacterium]|nr:dockerin type I domain-containing protein [Candidatus Saccharimonadia bacterium]
MSWATSWHRSARWGLWSLCVGIFAAPLPAAAFAFATSWEGSPCTASAWSFVAGGGVAGGPYGATPVLRYSGACAYRVVDTNGSLRSDHPANEPTYRARFYVFPQTSAGAVVLFQARNASGVPQFSIAHDPVADAFLVYIGMVAAGAPDTMITGASEFRWYSVEVSYGATQKLGVTVHGAGSGTPIAVVTSVASVADSSIDTASLGWLATANGNPTGAINFDAFESNNLASPIGPLCRGDVNGDSFVDGNDYQMLTEEILRRRDAGNVPIIATGQPDCTEDGKLDAFDRVCVVKLAGACP